MSLRLAASLMAVPLARGLSIVPGLGSIASQYDAILLDQFGVLHDGTKAIPGAIACYDRLAAEGKRLCVLSNSSRRRATSLGGLPKLGYDGDKLSGFVTSGEEAYQHMARRWVGKRALWISWAEGFNGMQNDYLAGLDLELAPAADADFIVCQGSQLIKDGAGGGVELDLLRRGTVDEALEEALATCAARGLPMVCANPDLHVILSDGTRGHMPGLVARRYEELGGKVDYFGKPHAPAFEACLASLGNVPRHRVLHVGDSLAHDVAGASASGVHCLFIASGIHAAELGVPEGAEAVAALRADAGAHVSLLKPGRLERAFEQHSARPTHTALAFQW